MTTTTAQRHPYTGKSFFNPLLKALAELTDYTPYGAVKLSETYEPICTEMGITTDQFGELSDGKPQVCMWVQEAFKSLKKHGLGSSTDNAGMPFRRGWWALTPKGVDKARELVGQPATPVSPATQTVPDPAPETEDKTEEAEPEGYHPDPYIRALAVEQTNCYGHFDAAEGACQECPLSHECSIQVGNEFAAYCRDMMKRLERGKSLPAAPASPAPAADDTDPVDPLAAPPSPATTPFRVTPTAQVVEMDTLGGSVCFVCGETIPEGVKVKWVRSSAEGKSGICHIECLEVSP